MASDLLIRIGADLSALNGRLKQAENRLKRFGFRAESIGKDLTARITLPIVGIGAAAVKTFAEFDRIEKGLAALAGTAEGGAAQFERLNAIVNDTQTTLDLKQAALGAQRLQTAGLSAQQAEETIRQLGIAATASGASIDDVGGVFRQFGQIIGKSKIEQEDLNTILDRVPALGAIIKEEFGTATAEGIRDTGISMQEFVVRTTEAIAANEKIQSVQGGLAKAFESFGNAVQVGIRPLGKAIADALNLEENLARLADFITRTSKAFSELNPSIQRFVIFTAGAAAAVGPLTFALGAVARSLPLLRSGFLTLSGPILGALGTFQAFLSGFVSGDRVLRRLAIDKAITRIRVAMVAVTGPIGIAVGVIALLTAGFIKAYRNSETFRNLLNRAGESVKQIGGFIADLVNRVLPDLNISFSTIGDAANVVFAAIGAGIAFIVSQFDAFVRTVRDVGASVSAFLSGDFDRAGELIAGSLLNPVQFVRQAKESAEEAVRVFRESVEGEDAVELPAINTNNLFNDTAPAPTPSAGGGGVFTSVVDSLNNTRFGEGVSFFDRLSIAAQGAQISARDLESRISSLQVSLSPTAFTSYQEGLDVITSKQELFGQSFNAVSAEVQLLQTILNQVAEGSLAATSTQIETYSARLAELNTQQELQNETLERQNEIMERLGGVASKAFGLVEQKLSQGKSAFEAFAQAAGAAIRDVIKEEIRLAVVNAASSVFKTVPFPLNVALAAGAGAGASALFNGLLQSLNIPFLADGGITTGAGLFVAGEAGPEAIIPLDRLNDFMQSGPSELYGEIRADGSELLVVMQAAQARQNRSYGN
jgi:tape measure domain-containing protein